MNEKASACQKIVPTLSRSGSAHGGMGERQKVGGPVSAALGRTAHRIPRKINRLKGMVADLPRL